MARVIAMCPLTFMDVQIEIHKAFVYAVCILAKEHEVLVLFDQNKRFKMYRDLGFLNGFDKNGIEYKNIGSILTNYNDFTKEFQVDTSFLSEPVFSKKFDEMFVYAAPIISAKDIKNKIEKYEQKKKIYCSFMSMKPKYNSYLIMHLINKKFKLNFKQMIVDYKEPNFQDLFDNVDLFGCYPNEDNGITTLFLYENYLFRKGIIDVEKDIKFCFGYTITYTEREYLSQIISDNIIEDDDYIIHANDRFWKGVGRNDIVNQTEYYDLMSRTKFSLVVPANNPKEFSLQRFYECISRKCIPLIMSRCNIENAFKGFEGFKKFYEQHNIIWDPCGGKTINEFVDALDYNMLIDKFYKLPEIKMLLDKEEMKKRMLSKYRSWV